MATARVPQNGQIHEMTREESRSLFDRQVRLALDMSGDEFLRKWDAGEFGEDTDRPEIMRLALLIPFGR